MAEVTSREKALYWVLIALLLIIGAAAVVYYFVSARQGATSLSDVTTLTGGQPTATENSVSTQSLADIVAPGQPPTVNEQAPQQPPIVAPTPQPEVNRVNQLIEVGNALPVNQLIEVGNQQNQQNQLITATPQNVTSGSTATSLSSGSALPEKSPTTGVSALVLSGIASLGISGLAGAMALRRPGKRGRTTRR